MRAELPALEGLVAAYGEGDGFPVAMLGGLRAAARLDELLTAALAGVPSKPPPCDQPRSAMLDAFLGLVVLRQAFGMAVTNVMAAGPAVANPTSSRDQEWSRELLR